MIFLRPHPAAEMEQDMERDDSKADLIELGTASIETQGMAGPTTDLQVGFRPLGLEQD